MSWGGHNKLPQIGGFETTEVDCLPVPEARSLKSGVSGCLPLKALGEDPSRLFQLLVAVVIVRVLGLWLPLWSLSLHSLLPVSSCDFLYGHPLGLGPVLIQCEEWVEQCLSQGHIVNPWHL